MLQLMQEINTMSLDRFQASELATIAEYERSRASRHLIADFMRDLRKLSIGLVLTLYVTFGHESFLKGPVVLFTQELIELRLDGLPTQIELSYGRLGDLYIPLRYPYSWKDRGESLMRS